MWSASFSVLYVFPLRWQNFLFTRKKWFTCWPVPVWDFGGLSLICFFRQRGLHQLPVSSSLHLLSIQSAEYLIPSHLQVDPATHWLLREEPRHILCFLQKQTLFKHRNFTGNELNRHWVQPSSATNPQFILFIERCLPVRETAFTV